MSAGKQAAAELRPTMVWLNLGDLNQLLEALVKNSGRRRNGRVSPEDRPLIRKIERARDRRLRAVSRAARA